MNPPCSLWFHGTSLPTLVTQEAYDRSRLDDLWYCALGILAVIVCSEARALPICLLEIKDLIPDIGNQDLHFNKTPHSSTKNTDVDFGQLCFHV